jgi:hypothetical protein
MSDDFPEDLHEVYAIRYAHHARRSPENFIGGDPHDVLQPLDYFVWAIVGRARRHRRRYRLRRADGKPTAA